MEATQITKKRVNITSNYTLWEEDGIVHFYFEKDTYLDTELVIQMFDEYREFNSMTNKLTLVNLDGIEGATLEGLSLLNQKLDHFSRNKAILVNNEKTELIGRVLVNSLTHKKPTKVFKSALQADLFLSNNWLN